MTFRILGLDPAPFLPLFGLSDAELAEHGAVRMAVEEPHAAPCRVTLADAEPGETMLLLNHAHQPKPTPFRANGPIFVRETAGEAYDRTGEIPDPILRRPISARAYDAAGMMTDGEVLDGKDAAALLTRWLERPEVDEIHLHYARRGCFAARVVRS
ncbi:MAG: DUF1203 domain-containing protein [Caulobacteraceae bacterium]